MVQPYQPQPDAPIGVFDSGLGGLRVLDRLLLSLPDERFVYLGDTLHMPYGMKSHDEVRGYVAACLQWLFAEHRVKMMVVACNTATAVAADLFEQPGYNFVPFVGPVVPICRWLHAEERYRRVGVMATPATVAANRYQKILDGLGSSIELQQMACGGLASTIEAGEGDSEECRRLLRGYVSPLVAWQAEAIVLGCTHYPYVADQIAAMVPHGVDILDPSVFMAVEARRLLKEWNLAAPVRTGRQLGEVDYFVTAEPERFLEVSQRMPFQAVATRSPRVVRIPSVDVPAAL